MRHASNAKTIKVSRMLEDVIIDDNDIIINNNSNSFIDGLDNKSLENEKLNKSTNIAIII